MRDTTHRSILVDELLSSTPKQLPLKTLNAIEYGRENERKAIVEYQKLTKRRVKACGLFVHPEYGYLAASPDGLIGNDGILEVKCPYAARRIIPYKIPRFQKYFFCFSTGDSKLKLKRRHNYYYQIQGQLEITNRDYCDLVIWTRRGIHVERILRDKSVWEEMLPKLRAFYNHWLLPELVNSRNARQVFYEINGF